jgi:hypothetical protein
MVQDHKDISEAWKPNESIGYVANFEQITAEMTSDRL